MLKSNIIISLELYLWMSVLPMAPNSILKDEAPSRPTNHAFAYPKNGKVKSDNPLQSPCINFAYTMPHWKRH